MTTISVPLPPHMIEFIEQEVRMGNYENKAMVIRKAIALFEENRTIEAVLRSEKDVREGKVFYGDLKEIAKKFKK